MVVMVVEGGGDEVMMLLTSGDGRSAGTLARATAWAPAASTVSEAFSTPAVRDMPAFTTASAVEVRVADGMTVPLLTVSNGIWGNTVSEVAMVTEMALEASV